jgi:hypothetical protein
MAGGSNGDPLGVRVVGRVPSLFKAGFRADSIDIEKVISLYVASGISEHQELAEELRDAYFS